MGRKWERGRGAWCSVDGWMDRWMNWDGLALGRALVRYLVGLLIGGLVLCSIGRKRIGRRRRDKGGGNGL